ncbi:hypothetical protein HC891_02795 [Candidatus Gracilibacteria bacterium]|nr:hypothetical protein [Candidatus Gracilibacteria bacterium]
MNEQAYSAGKGQHPMKRTSHPAGHSQRFVLKPYLNDQNGAEVVEFVGIVFVALVMLGAVAVVLGANDGALGNALSAKMAELLALIGTGANGNTIAVQPIIAAPIAANGIPAALINATPIQAAALLAGSLAASAAAASRAGAQALSTGQPVLKQYQSANATAAPSGEGEKSCPEKRAILCRYRERDQNLLHRDAAEVLHRDAARVVERFGRLGAGLY